jgi:hypothetical protein
VYNKQTKQGKGSSGFWVSYLFVPVKFQILSMEQNIIMIEAFLEKDKFLSWSMDEELYLFVYLHVGSLKIRIHSIQIGIYMYEA